MHAVIVEVRIDTDKMDEAARMLHENVVPGVSATPGYVAGYWLEPQMDGEVLKGFSMVVFETEEAAQGAASSVTSQVPPFVHVDSVTVRGIVASKVSDAVTA